jgi:hypothetical protein
MGFESTRELLLVEVARRCRECGEPARLGLTKAEARSYRGFECDRCESWNDDELAEQDVPEWWAELRDGRRRGLRLVSGGSGGGRAAGEDY